MIIFGLTGNIAMGKSAVTATFRKHGVPIIDADIVARQVVEPGTFGLSLIIGTFGSDYLLPDGTLDRSKLGLLVFSDKDKLSELNDIIQPLIEKNIDLQIENYRNNLAPIIGVDAALIIENGNAKKYSPLIVVKCTPEQQLERLMKRGTNDQPLTKQMAMNRIKAQISAENKVKYADYVIDTSLAIENSIEQTLKIIDKLKS